MGVNELPELIYLDHQATTPVDPAVLAAMLPYLGGRFGNASSAHLAGQMAADAVRAGRDQVAAMIDGRPQSVIFTSGSTEANNLALGGLFAASTGRRHLVTVATEHPSVLEPAHRWERSGGRVTVLAVDAQGRIDLEELREAMSEDTLVVSVMAANNEIGTLAPVAEIAEIAHAAGALYHCDATQAIGRIPVSVSASDIDLLSISSHKFYGPKGVGALYVSRAAMRRIDPAILGGGHEQGLRSGTLNVPGIVGMGVAADLAATLLPTEPARLNALTSSLWKQLETRLPQVEINGPTDERLPGNLSVTFEGTDGEDLMLRMPTLAVSTGSACSSASPAPSPVLLAIGKTHDQAQGSLRFGAGRFTSQAEVDAAAELVVAAVERARAQPVRRGA